MYGNLSDGSPHFVTMPKVENPRIGETQIGFGWKTGLEAARKIKNTFLLFLSNFFWQKFLEVLTLGVW